MTKVIYTAIFGHHDNLYEPLVITPGWRMICYTDDPLLKSDHWEIKIINGIREGQERMMARLIKLNSVHFTDHADQSIWIDASFQVNVDLDQFWEDHFKKEMTVIKHPERSCFYKEAELCKRIQKDNPIKILNQEKAYLDIVPENNGLIQSGILLRTNSQRVIRFCYDWWQETKKHSNRDQLSFCKVSIGKDFIHYIDGYVYDQREEFKYFGHIKK